MVPAHAVSAWTIQTVGPSTNGEPISLAIGSNGNPHIAYSNYPNTDEQSGTWNITYASWNGSAWNIQTIAPQIRGQGSHLALDSDNNPHICYDYSSPFESELNYASWTGSNWTIQTVDSVVASSTFYGDSFALDSSNYPHILYGVQTGTATYYGEPTVLYNVKYADWNGSGWSIQTVFTNATSFSNIALDSHSYPHFTYTINGPLKYASWNGSTWKTQTIDSKPGYNDAGFYASDVCTSSFLTIDQHNNPHISYWRYNYVEDTSNDVGLMYAYWTGSSWNIQNVDSNGTVYGAGPIALDSAGNPHIVYPSLDSELPSYFVSIKYATLTGSTTTPSTPLSLVILLSLVIAVIAIVLVVSIIAYKRKYRRHLR